MQTNRISCLVLFFGLFSLNVLLPTSSRASATQKLNDIGFVTDSSPNLKSLRHHETQLTKKLNSDPSDFESRFAYSQILMSTFRWKEALDQVNYALQVRPHSGRAHRFKDMIQQAIRADSQNDLIAQMKRSVVDITDSQNPKRRYRETISFEHLRRTFQPEFLQQGPTEYVKKSSTGLWTIQLKGVSKTLHVNQVQNGTLPHENLKAAIVMELGSDFDHEGAHAIEIVSLRAKTNAGQEFAYNKNKSSPFTPTAGKNCDRFSGSCESKNTLFLVTPEGDSHKGDQLKAATGVAAAYTMTKDSKVKTQRALSDQLSHPLKVSVPHEWIPFYSEEISLEVGIQSRDRGKKPEQIGGLAFAQPDCKDPHLAFIFFDKADREIPIRNRSQSRPVKDSWQCEYRIDLQKPAAEVAYWEIHDLNKAHKIQWSFSFPAIQLPKVTNQMRPPQKP